MTENKLRLAAIEDVNPNCDGIHCQTSKSKVRIIPLDDSCNIHLCPTCYHHELIYNQQLELEGKSRSLPELPFETYPLLLPVENSSY